VLVLLPGRPDEVCFAKVLDTRRRPPVTLLDYISNELRVVAAANIVFLGVLQQALLVLLLLEAVS
jgi:hypothetical protein